MRRLILPLAILSACATEPTGGRHIFGYTPIPAGNSGQDPSNVAITGGTITGVNTATRTVQGAESAADKAFGLDNWAWRQTQYNTIIADCPNITSFRYIKVPLASNQTTATVTGDGNIEGGGASAPGGTNYYVPPSIFQNTPGGNWAIAGRVKFPANSGVENAQFGIASVTGPATDAVWLGVLTASDSSHFFGRINKAGTHTDITTTVASDTSSHDFVITDDGTTVRMRIDGVLAGSTTTRTNLIATAMLPYFGPTTNPMIITDLYVGYVAP